MSLFRTGLVMTALGIMRIMSASRESSIRYANARRQVCCNGYIKETQSDHSDS